MLTILGSIIGFLSSALPAFADYFKRKQDMEHEIRIFEMQVKMAEIQHQNNMEESAINADASQFRELYKTYNVGITWIDGLNALIRPILAIAFFSLYVYVKWLMVNAGYPIWDEEDAAIFASVIAFYFGNRSFDKVRKRNG